MKVFVVDNAHLCKDKTGKYYSPSVYSYGFLSRYLKVFDEVRFIGKVKYFDEIDTSKYNLVSGKGVEIVELPWYQGLKQMIKKLPQLLKIYRKSCKSCDCYIFRVAQIESFFVYLFGRKRKTPFAVEVVNDPETFVDMPGIMRWFCVTMLKRMVIKANGASYVTEHALQQKYPNKKEKSAKTQNHFETYYSSVNLEDEDVYETPISYNKGETLKIVHVSNAINTDIKGHYTLINAAASVIEKGGNIEVICIGDGTKVNEYKEYIRGLKLDSKIRFTGRLNDKNVLLKTLRECHLMVLPTQMEGLPRTIIEAMAVGLPCLSTPIAGIPELLEERYMFEPMDYEGFADKIIQLIENPDELKHMSEQNIKKAKQFTKSVLEKRRTLFYNKLREQIKN